MAISSASRFLADKALSPKSRNAVLQQLASVASLLTAEQLDDFIERLGEALLKLSEQSVRPVEASLSLNAYNYLRLQRQELEQAISDCLAKYLSNEIRLLEAGEAATGVENDADLSLVTFEEMENKVLLGNIAQAIDRDIAESLSALNFRIGTLLGREDMTSAENPFRPQIFIQAIYQGWCKIDPAAESHRVVLRLLGPELFLPLESVFQQLNALLIERGILPDLTEAYRLKRVQNRIGLPPVRSDKYKDARFNKLRDWLLSAGKKKTGSQNADDDLNVPDLFALGGEGEGWNNNTISVKVGPRLFSYLNTVQQQIDRYEASAGTGQDANQASTLRQVKEQAPPGALTNIDENTIELLAKMFDYVFKDETLPPELKRLIGQLQIPLLKAALIDKKFFIKNDHPARLLIDTLVNSGMAWEAGKAHDDPLYKMVEQIVARVQKDFDQQMGLFADVVSNLDSYLEAEEKVAQSELAEPIAKALREEKTQRARQAAESDIAARIETGEVATFVEVFLETQWTRILTLAHSAKEQKPDVLEKALKTMDDLIWSVKPKNSPEQRKELISRLPSILSMLNAWLNAIKWNEPERVEFFSNLAERHAMIVRLQPELSSRHHIEIAVNIAEKASHRRMRIRSTEKPENPADQFALMVESLAQGNWLEFTPNNGVKTRYRLAWVSPRRSRFVFASRAGQEPCTFTAQELAHSLRQGKAVVIEMESMVDRALSAALDAAE